MFATCGISVCAATTTKTLKQNVWFTQKFNKDTVYNKITVPGDGYITLTVSNSKKNYLWIDLYDKKKNFSSGLLSTTDKSKTVKLAVSKGTYYLKGSSYANYKYKWKFTKVANKANYCASKATALSANKEVIVINTPMNTYDRWYKIKLTKKKAIEYSYSGSYVSLYDADMNTLDVEYDEDEKCYYTRKRLPKGTYYVRVPSSYYYNSCTKAYMTTFKWK